MNPHTVNAVAKKSCTIPNPHTHCANFLDISMVVVVVYVVFVAAVVVVVVVVVVIVVVVVCV